MSRGAHEVAAAAGASGSPNETEMADVGVHSKEDVEAPKAE